MQDGVQMQGGAGQYSDCDKERPLCHTHWPGQAGGGHGGGALLRRPGQRWWVTHLDETSVLRIRIQLRVSSFGSGSLVKKLIFCYCNLYFFLLSATLREITIFSSQGTWLQKSAANRIQFLAIDVNKKKQLRKATEPRVKSFSLRQFLITCIFLKSRVTFPFNGSS